jgi:hypothetical protein
MPLCQYKNALGKPDEGIHSWRVGGFAAADVLLTGGLALLVSKGLLKSSNIAVFMLVFITLVLIAVLIHEEFCVNTKLNSLIFNRPFPAKTESPKLKA